MRICLVLFGMTLLMIQCKSNAQEQEGKSLDNNKVEQFEDMPTDTQGELPEESDISKGQEKSPSPTDGTVQSEPTNIPTKIASENKKEEKKPSESLRNNAQEKSEEKKEHIQNEQTSEITKKGSDMQITQKQVEDVTSDTKEDKPDIPKKVIVEQVEPVQLKNKEDMDKSKSATKPANNKVDHALFQKLLQGYVSGMGVVNYKGLKKEVEILDDYLSILSTTNVKELGTGEQLAFWINAYNAYTLKLIIDNYPIKSITDLDGGKPWDKKWININGQKLSLNNIENDIIRPQFKEPRIHFAVNCAAKSCPPLSNQVWQAGNLNTNMRNLTRDFINNPKYNQIKADHIRISKIFEWYAVDFGDIITFLNKYSEQKINDNAKVEYLDYDWSLNGK